MQNLLKEKKFLACKPNSGASGGRGFMKWQWHEGTILVNNRPTSPEEFRQITAHLENHVVTEYARQHEALSRIWPDSECTLRVIMAKLPQERPTDSAQWCNTVSFARFGTSLSGGASNLSSGGVGIGFDFETGRFYTRGIRYKKFCPDGNYFCTEHPDTHVVWEDFTLPNWPLVRERIDRVCRHIGSLDYLGLDIIITPEGMKFCEINSHPAADYAQVLCHPILSDPRARGFFAAHGLFDVNTEDFYRLYMQAQKE